MATPIPYKVQNGETLQDIAKKLGVKDWTELKKYHNQNAGSDQQTSDIPYAGFNLLTPTQEEIYEMNSETPPPDPVKEQKDAEQKQGDEKKKEEEQKKEEKASKSDHDGKYFVVHNAKCVCDKAENPKQTADLQVTTHKIIVLNDDSSKLAATEEDKTFIPPAATFGKCTLKPSSAGNLPCALAAAPKWSKTYESTQVMGKNTLTEISELQCMVGGKITIDKHGQTDSVSNAHADNTNPLELAMVNPAIAQPKKKEEYPVVTFISLTKIEDRKDFKEVDSKKKEIIYLRKNEEADFKANLKSGNKQLTSWMVYSDHQGKKESRLFLKEQIGTEFSQSFADLGKFRVEGYGKPKSPDFEKGKYDKCDSSCSIDVEVVENTLIDIECTSGDFTTRIDPSKNRKFRKGVPSVFKAKFFIPNLTAEEKSKLTLSVQDGSGNTITEGVQENGESLTFTPKNSKAKYTIIARYTNDKGEVIEKQIAGETEGNAVLGISHGAEVVRPGTAMSFSVSKMKYKFGTDNSPYDLTSEESSEIKWNLNGILQGTGKSINITGSKLMAPGKYVVEAYSISANATGKNAKKEDDDWHFEVKENIVTEIKAGKKARTGSEVPFEISKTLLNGYESAKDGPIVWKITGPASGTGNGEKFNYKFILPGDYTIDCLMGGRSSQNPLKIKVIQPKILLETSKWIDNDGGSGNIIKEAGYGQEVCAYVKYEGLQGEEVTLQIYDNDSNGINLVHNIAASLPETGGVYWPFTLDNSIKLKIEAKGLTKDGKLHFKIAPKDATLKIVNGDKSLGEYLKVTNVPKIVDAYFCDATDTEKLYNSPMDKALYFKIYAINMVDKKVEVHFMTKSDIYFDVAWNPKQWKDWKDVKEKFSKETFFYKTEGTINKKGELIVKVDPSKLGKPKNYFKISAVVKITEGEGKDAKEKAAYADHTDMAILYATAKLPDMVENKGAVKVGREQLTNSSNCGGKFCIKKGSPKSELIREINIRLAGFGGNVPTDEFTDRTEKMIKQFQKDYMKVHETGKVCGNVLKAIDEFSNKWVEKIVDYKCLCHASDSKVKKENRCPGYGKDLNNEHPGIHRTLLWGISTLKFYLAQQSNYKYRETSAGYRCWAHNNSIPRKSTNHMGKAVDIQFNDGTYEISGKINKNLKPLKEIRDKFYINYLKAEEGWSIPSKKNNYRMEPIGMGKDESYSWIHVDVTLFETQYLADTFFTKEQNSIIGKSVVDFANELGFKDMCACLGGFTSTNNNTQTSSGNCEDRFSKVAPIILKHEGGYVNHASDKGGPTNKGITLATWQQYAKEDVGVENPTLENLKQITDQQATTIYRKRYWEPKKFCEIKDERVSLMFYDWTITSGGAVKQVQKLLKNEFQQDIEPDGGMGSLTVKAINDVEDQNKLLNKIAEIRKQYYTDLTYTNGKKNDQDDFLDGWLNRVDKCLEFKP